MRQLEVGGRADIVRGVEYSSPLPLFLNQERGGTMADLGRTDEGGGLNNQPKARIPGTDSQ